METKEKEIYRFIITQLTDKMNRVGLSEDEMPDDFSLTKTGLLDSLAFVNLVSQIEKKFNIEIDFEEAFQNPDFTNISGLINVISKQLK
ncbi:MAG TPA: acyl carrier protein [Bacteroidales bacterium]|nr:acyl carrier protein [Bacteroidales bacterium]